MVTYIDVDDRASVTIAGLMGSFVQSILLAEDAKELSRVINNRLPVPIARQIELKMAMERRFGATNLKTKVIENTKNHLLSLICERFPKFHDQGGNETCYYMREENYRSGKIYKNQC